MLVGAGLLAATAPRVAALRLVPVFACAALLHAGRGAATRAVRAERAPLVAALPALLEPARRVATLDVGWVGAAGDYSVIDLAGVTDPEVAYLPGGHTSKRLPPDFLERRRVDALVLLAPTPRTEPARYARQVEAHVMQLRGADAFREVGRIALDATQEYVVLRRESGPE